MAGWWAESVDADFASGTRAESQRAGSFMRKISALVAGVEAAAPYGQRWRNMRRRFTLLVILISATWASGAGVVTFTMRLHETANGALTTAIQFVIYATASQGDNSGLFAYSLDLRGAGELGGPTTLTLVN